MTHRRFISLIVFFFSVASLFSCMPSVAPGPAKSILFIAGRPSHGSGEHEHHAGCQLLAKILNEQSGLNLKAKVHKYGWPKDKTIFDGVDTVVLYSDGGGGNPAARNKKQMAALIEKGVSFMTIHYACEVAKKDGDTFRDWIGGAYEHSWSCNPKWNLKSELNKKHPVSRGVKPFEVMDEWYINMRFRKDKKGVTDLLQGLPTDKTRDGPYVWPRGPYKHIQANKGRKETVMWCVEHKSGAKGIGFTGGHFHRNWANLGFRTTVLNAIVWSSGLEVPKNGVKSTEVDEDAINANLDKKNGIKRIKLTK